MNDNTQKSKRTIVIGVENQLSSSELKFFGSRFNIKEVSFKTLLKGEKNVHFIYFNGGADVSPKLYNEKKIGKFTNINPDRDALCAEVFQALNRTAKLGICRGSQFVTAMSGGKLVQHVEGHTKMHDINMHFEGQSHSSTFKITSTHHQMMFPYNLPKNKYNILGWATKHNSLIYLDGENKQMLLPEKFVEPEIVYYPMSRSLAIQGHPEFDNCDERTRMMCLNLIEDYLI